MKTWTWCVLLALLLGLGTLLACSNDASDDDVSDNVHYDRGMDFHINCMGYAQDDTVTYCETLLEVSGE